MMQINEAKKAGRSPALQEDCLQRALCAAAETADGRVPSLRVGGLNMKNKAVGAAGNIGRAWKEAAEAFGFSLTQSCPDEFRIPETDCIENLRDAIVGKDIVCTDSFPLEMLNGDNKYQVTKEIMNLANAEAVLNPCPPFYRGEEVSDDVIDSEYFVGYEFKKNLLRVQQAIIVFCMKK